MEFSHNKAIYLQITDLVCEGILAGTYTEEERIPSVREMAMNLEVNPNTVFRAYEELQGEGLIYNRRGLGFFISAGAKKNVKEKLRGQFLSEEAPRIGKIMEMLDIPPEELTAMLVQQINKNQKS
jgi:GntR family transcriptional regulator